MSSEHLSMNGNKNSESSLGSHNPLTILRHRKSPTNWTDCMKWESIWSERLQPGSVIVYFSCQTFQSIVAFKHMVVNGELTRILEDLFNCILGLSALFHVKLMVSLSETEYRSCIENARRTSKAQFDFMRTVEWLQTIIELPVVVDAWPTFAWFFYFVIENRPRRCRIRILWMEVKLE